MNIQHSVYFTGKKKQQEKKGRSLIKHLYKYV